MSPKILIVDDDQPTRTGLAMLLVEAGYEAVSASTVPTAIKLLSEEHPDLLLVDIRLDEYNGLHVVATRPEPIPAIVLTGFADPSIEADARRLGAEFLLKPVKPAVLTSLIQRLLADARVGRAIPRRWPRKPVLKDVNVDIDDAAVRMLDVSYGGVCVEMRRSAGVGPPGMFRMIVSPEDRPVPVEVVWTRRRDATTWLCGGMVSEDNVANWRTLVDSFA
jgi:CheY-like chemotaxis protein